SRERKPVANLVFRLLIRKIVQGLQYQHAEQHDRINGFPAGTTLLHLIRRQHDRLDVGTKALPRHQSIDGFERITLRRQRRQPLLSVEEPELTHPCLPNHAVANETRTTQSEWPFFEAPIRTLRPGRTEWIKFRSADAFASCLGPEDSSGSTAADCRRSRRVRYASNSERIADIAEGLQRGHERTHALQRATYVR